MGAYHGLDQIVRGRQAVNSAKMLRLARERDQRVVVRYEGRDGLSRQTPPVHVLAVDDIEAGDSVHHVALLDRGGRRTNPFSLNCAKITLVHPALEEPPEEA